MKVKVEKPKEYQRARIVLQLCGIACDDKQAWKIVRAVRGYEKLGGKFSIKDACKIIAQANEKFNK